ncbi:hypothetical protein [Paenibacillus sp. S150]|uniref:hypothetical protein n=1 Tax=Paenibacillus sp. S150 TaxID=2749826 RepID=UPI001C59CA12|nr:hypothetical protein [Paenibacillus sp. S150]MBW4084542.1 hypothetical protein [Paenibacillus sp. S150]
MESAMDLVKVFQELEERINAFINDDSSIEYIEGSAQVVEGGAFSWSRLKPADLNKQTFIHSEYTELAVKVRAILTDEESPNIAKFEHSSALVINYILQDTLLWLPGIKNVIDDIKTELDLQQLFISEHME